MADTPFHLTGKTILVTGASAGIGAQCAVSISRMGGTVAITARDEQRLNETMSKLSGSGHTLLACDLTDENQLKALTDFAPACDGVVHCAGIAEIFPVKYINRQKINETFEINYISSVLLMTGLFGKRKIKKGASVVFLSSIAAKHPFGGGALYAGSKAALEKYAQVLAREHAAAGIRSNCIAPAMVKTHILEQALERNAGDYQEEESKYLLGFGETADVANLAVYLLSDAARWMTGQVIVIDGGYSLMNL